MADWSQLPYDLIELIASQFPIVEEFLLFSAVCHSWRLVYLNRDRISTHRDTWLMLGYEHEVYEIRFFSLSRFKVYKLPLPEAQGCRCWGTSHGWIATFNRYLAICLLNPITQACVYLPPLPVSRSKVLSEATWFAAVQQAIVLKLRGRFITMVIYGHYCYLAFARLGDSEWIQFPNPARLLNIVCCKDQLWGLTLVGTLVFLDIDGPYSPRTRDVASPPENLKFWWRLYLVESSENLLLVCRWYDDKMLRFKVYKFDVCNSKWMVIEELGNNLLLVDSYNCYSVSAFGPLKCNCIYFSHGNLNYSMSEPKVQSITKYDIKDHSSDVYWFYNDSPLYFSPEWMMVTL